MAVLDGGRPASPTPVSDLLSSDQINLDPLLGLSVLRNQDAVSSLISLRPDIVLVDKHGEVALEVVAISPRVVDELLRQQDISGFRQRFDAGGDDDNVGNFRMQGAFQGGIEFPEAAMGADPDLQVVPGDAQLGAEAYAARSSLPGLRSARTRESPAAVFA